MHIILGLLGTVVTILVLLNRLQEGGIDIGWLNPFSWRRRRAFRKQYEMSAAYALESAMDVAALFMVAVAKVDGDMSKEQKDRILQLFMSEFKLTEGKAKELLGSSVHIYGRGDEVLQNPKAVIARSYESFTDSQIESVVYMLKEVSIAEGEPSTAQKDIIKRVISELPNSNKSGW